MANDQKWNPGLQDGIGFHNTDPTGFFIGLLRGQPICCISAVRHGSIGHIGYYVVEKQYRGRGYGMKMFGHAMKYLHGCNIRLDAVLTAVDKYKKSGFLPNYCSTRYTGTIDSKDVSCPNIYSAADISFDKIVQYDACYYGENRKYFLSTWLTTATTNSLVYQDNDVIQGFGAIRKCHEGYRLGPVYAETSDIAKDLIYSLCQPYDKCKLTLEFADENLEGKKLMEQLNFQQDFQYITMFTQTPPQVNLRNIYCHTTH